MIFFSQAQRPRRGELLREGDQTDDDFTSNTTDFVLKIMDLLLKTIDL